MQFIDDFTAPDGGCYPWMPRLYSDESGADHGAGLELARILFSEAGPATRRSVVMLTYGRPRAGFPTAGTERAAQGYVEARWRELVTPVPASDDDVREAARAASDALWQEHTAHVWTVSLAVDDDMFDDLPTGDGSHLVTTDPSAIAALIDSVLTTP